MIIRDGAPEDRAGWLSLWQGFLDHYNVRLDPAVTDHTWARMMDLSHPMKLRLAERDGRLLGMAHYQNQGSTFGLGDDLYLEDLFVVPEARGMGIGAALVQDLIDLGRAKGWRRISWHTEAENPARRLYDRFVAADGLVRYRRTL